ncbi:putative membrane protein [Streptomyces ambofaciens]
MAAGLAATWAMSEHASVGLQAGLAMPVDVVHLIAVATWLGGLTALLVALYRGSADTPVPALAVRRFSRVAFGSVIALVVTGTYQSWRQLGSWTAFTDTRYGQLLLVKIGLVAVLVGVAYFSRRWTAQLAEAAPAVAGAARGAGKASGSAAVQAAAKTAGKASGNTSAKSSGKETGSGNAKVAEKGPGAAEDSGGSRRAAQLARQRAAVDAARQKRQRDADPNRFGLRRSVLAEASVAVVLLVVTTVLTQTEPGRTEEEAKAAGTSSATGSAPSTGAVTLDMPFDTGSQNGKGVIRVELDPARVGANDMHLYVERPDGTAFDIPEVKVALTQKAQDIGPLPVVPDHITTGHWSASGVQVPMAGDWEVAVTVRTSDIDQVTVSKNAQIG